MIAKPSEHTNVHKITVPMHNTRGIITLFDPVIISCSLVCRLQARARRSAFRPRLKKAGTILSMMVQQTVEFGLLALVEVKPSRHIALQKRCAFTSIADFNICAFFSRSFTCNFCVCSTEYCERACKMVPRSRLRVQAAAICSLELRFASAMYKREHIDRKCPVILNRKNNYLHAPTQHPTSSQISSTDERLRSKRNW